MTLRTDPVTVDAVANFLIERGSAGVVIKKSELQAFFAHSANDLSIRKALQLFLRDIAELFPGSEKPRLRSRVIKDRNWNRSWRRFIKPQKIGRRFWVGPPWIKPPLLRQRHLITIEPGLAFGTGTHATTRGCLELIEAAVHSLSGSPFNVLDVGTGSGILAIALAKLGATEVWALDNDPVALQVARKNLRCNAVRAKVRLSNAPISRIRKSFAIVVANLTAGTILEMAGGLERSVASGGFLIVSGLLASQASAVEQRFVSANFDIVRRKREKEWLTLLLRRE